MAVGSEHCEQGSSNILPIQLLMTLEFFFEATGEGYDGESACGDCKNKQRNNHPSAKLTAYSTAMYSYSYYIGTKTDGSGKMT